MYLQRATQGNWPGVWSPTAPPSINHANKSCNVCIGIVTRHGPTLDTQVTPPTLEDIMEKSQGGTNMLTSKRKYAAIMKL